MDFSKLNLQEHQVLARLILKSAIEEGITDRKSFDRLRNAFIKKHASKIFHNLYFVKAYQDMLHDGEIQESPDILALIQKRGVRTMSGVAPVTVLTKPFPCPGKCVYCPTDVRMPKSYLPSQPAAQRAFRQRFHPYTQVFVRLRALFMTGHKVSKVELRVIGGTWSSYPKTYQSWFLKQCLLAMNEFTLQMEYVSKNGKGNVVTRNSKVKSPYGVDKVQTVMLKSLSRKNGTYQDVVRVNESADVKCIGMNIETRPDCIDEVEIARLRMLGVTKVELGVQTTDDHVQELTKRGHDLKSVRDATALLKDAGFKIGYHMMPNLPGATPEMDKKMVGELFENDGYQPDYLKIYPCVVVQKAALILDFKAGRYKPYDDATLMDVLFEEMRSVPEWCRIDRVARDIPATDIVGSFTISNIRQMLEKRLNEAGIPCRDIRSREIGKAPIHLNDIEMVHRQYAASGGVEHFLSYEDVKQDKLLALLRLRFPRRTFLPELAGCAIIREVHVYGKQIAVGEHEKGQKQHIGWGRKLMSTAESMSREAGYKKMAVIAGIGTRDYYRKLGYELEGTYMVKAL